MQEPVPLNKEQFLQPLKALLVKIHLPPLFETDETDAASTEMDAHSQGLASALAELGISNLADLVDLARAGVLNEMILGAVEHHDLEQRVTEAVIVLAAAADRRSDRLRAMTLQVQLMRSELGSLEAQVVDLCASTFAAAPTIKRAACTQSWQRRDELPSARAAAAAERKAAAEDKKAAAVERAAAAAVCEEATAQKHAAEQLMESAKAKLAGAAGKLKEARELRELTHTTTVRSSDPIRIRIGSEAPTLEIHPKHPKQF